MAIYAIVPFRNDSLDDLKKKLQDVSKSAYVEHEPNVYFVEFSGSPKDLSYRIGISDSENSATGVVIKINGYYGRANRSLWDWLSQEENLKS